jgi:hypothetical protein
MKTVEEGSLSSDELLRMHRCTEAIRYLSAAGLIPTKQPEEVGAPQTGSSSSSSVVDAPRATAAAHSPPLRFGSGTGK